ncbi:MAG: 6-bladed beta-propeller [Tannerella sp.]|jgi:hypothetical protein|nr:6-bladed beta-propeller [Tannerella sp.]
MAKIDIGQRIKEVMNQLKNWALTLVCVFVLLSCKQQGGVMSTLLLTVDYTDGSEVVLSDYVDDVSVVALETDDDCLIGDVSKVQLFNGVIYVLDMRSNTLYAFDSAGGYVNKLYRVGQGPGEYLSLTDFEVTGDGVYVLDISTHKIICHGYDFRLLSEVKFNTLGSSFMMADDGYWLYNEYSGSGDDFQLSYNKAGELIERHFPRQTEPNKNYYMASSNVFQKSGGTLYFSPRFGNTIYKAEADSWLPVYELSFADKTYTSEMTISDDDVIENRYIFRRNFYILNSYVVVDYMFNRMRYFVFCDKAAGAVQSGAVHNDLIAGYERFFPRWSSGNSLIESVEAENVINEFPTLITYGALDGYKIDDNPLLVIYKFK